MAAGLLVGHHRRPHPVRIEHAALVDERAGRGFEHARDEPLAHQRALAVAAVRVEAVADHGPAVAVDVGDDGDEAQRHLREVDVGVADARADRPRDLADLDDVHRRVVSPARRAGAAHILLFVPSRRGMSRPAGMVPAQLRSISSYSSKLVSDTSGTCGVSHSASSASLAARASPADLSSRSCLDDRVQDVGGFAAGEDLGLGEGAIEDLRRQRLDAGPAAHAQLVVDHEQVAHDLRRRVVDEQAGAEVGALLHQQRHRLFRLFCAGRPARRAAGSCAARGGSSGRARREPSAASRAWRAGAPPRLSSAGAAAAAES